MLLVSQVADYVLLMSVNPGFGGQKLIPYVLDKVRKLDNLRREKRFVVQLNRELGEPQAVEVLCHEWAHALAARAQEVLGGAGQARSRPESVVHLPV